MKKQLAAALILSALTGVSIAGDTQTLTGQQPRGAGIGGKAHAVRTATAERPLNDEEIETVLTQIEGHWALTLKGTVLPADTPQQRRMGAIKLGVANKHGVRSITITEHIGEPNSTQPGRLRVERGHIKVDFAECELALQAAQGGGPEPVVFSGDQTCKGRPYNWVLMAARPMTIELLSRSDARVPAKRPSPPLP